MEKLPEAVLKHILSYVGNALDFLQCERSCKAFHGVLEDDAIWATCEECQPKYQNQQPYWPTKNREKAFVVRALVQCYDWQRRTNNSVIRSVLSAREWKGLVSQTINLLLRDQPNCGDIFSLRGDSSAVLMTIVQECLVLQLQRANYIAAYSDFRVSPYCKGGIWEYAEGYNQSEYPCLDAIDFWLQDHLTKSQDFHFGSNLDELSHAHHLGIRPGGQMGQRDLAIISDVLNIDHVKRDSIVRRLAYLAGVTKMEDKLFEWVWACMIDLIAALVKPACIQLGYRTAVRGEQQVLDHMGTMRDVAPHAELAETLCLECGERNILHTIVPKQVEEAAKRLGLPHTVLGAEWHVDSDSLNLDYDNAVQLMKQELAEARSKYCFGGSDDGSYASGASNSSDEESNDDERYVPDELADLVEGVAEVFALQGSNVQIVAGNLPPDNHAVDDDDGNGGSSRASSEPDGDESNSLESDGSCNDETYVQGEVSEEEDFELTDGEADDDSLVLVKFSAKYHAHAYTRDLFTPV